MKPPVLRIGVDLGGTKTALIALDPAGEVLLADRRPTPRSQGYRAILLNIRDMVRDAEAQLGERARVGIGVPGALSPKTGRIRNANTTCLNGAPLLQDLCETLDRTVRIANDADCFALSEAHDGAGAGARVVFAVIAGTGTGGGVVVQGQLLQGPNAIAGEWGHTPLPWPEADELPGPACYCGRRGCVETWLSGPGLAADHLRHTGQECTAIEIADAAVKGDGTALATLQRHAERFARSLAVVINILDPDVVVLGGGISQIAGLVASIEERWARHIFTDVVRTRLSIAKYGDASGVRGAAWL